MIGNAAGWAGYQAALGRQDRINEIRRRAQKLDTSFLTSFVQEYESGTGRFYRFLASFLDIEPPEIVAYRVELNERKETGNHANA